MSFVWMSAISLAMASLCSSVAMAGKAGGGQDRGVALHRLGIGHAGHPRRHPLECLRQGAVDREVRDTDPTARRQHAVHLGCSLRLAREGAEGATRRSPP